jgi:hypothetical protein
LILLILSLSLLVVVIGLVTRQFVPTDAPRAASDEASFPTLRGTNLRFEEINIPQGLTGRYRLLVVAYNSEQQPYVEKWLGPLEALTETYPDLMGYYLPLLPQETADAALPILGGMTLAAQNDRDRARTIVVFTDVTAFNDLVQVTDTERIQLFLLSEDHRILWQAVGGYRPELLAELETTLANLNNPS